MIIEFPTALYSPVLPQSASDAGSVTFEISSDDPPRQSQNLQQLPIAEQLKPLPSKIFSRREDRDTAGDFVFSLSESHQSEIGSNKKQFEIGQFLEFVREETTDISRTEVPGRIDLQQNTNILDLSSLGLTDSEIVSITDQAEDSFNEVVIDINSLREDINNNKASISENKKSQNEAQKAIDAIKAIGNGSSDILQKLLDKQQELLNEQDSLISSTNILNEEIESKFADLLSIRELVR